MKLYTKKKKTTENNFTTIYLSGSSVLNLKLKKNPFVCLFIFFSFNCGSMNERKYIFWSQISEELF